MPYTGVVFVAFTWAEQLSVRFYAYIQCRLVVQLHIGASIYNRVQVAKLHHQQSAAPE